MLKKAWNGFRDFNAQQIDNWERIHRRNRPWEASGTARRRQAAGRARG